MVTLIDKLDRVDLDKVLVDGVVDYEVFVNEYLPLKEFDNFKQLNNRYEKQAVPLPGTAEPGYSSIYRNVISKDGLVTSVLPELDTVLKHFEKISALKPHYNALGKRLPTDVEGKFDEFFTFQSYGDLKIEKDQFGSGLRNLLNTIENEDEIISIFSPNRPEWVISSYACQTYDLTTTALYDTLGPKTSKYILNFTKSPILITTLDKITKIITLADQKIDPTEDEELRGLPYLKFIVSMDELNFKEHYGLVQLAESFGIKLLDLKQVVKIGKEIPIPANPAKFESILSISFTSGTTGYPKGVLITHKMAVAAMAFCYGQIGIDIPKKHEQIKYFSFLPLAHIYELMNIYSNVSKGYEIAFPPVSSPLTLVENLKLYKPHFVTLVPRVYSKFESALKSGLNNGFVGKNVISKLLEYKENSIGQTNESAKNISKGIFYVDNPIVKKMRAAVGFDEVQLCVSGSAPIAKETIQFLKSAFNTEFYQGYGLTESFAGICIETSNQNDQTSGTVGITTEIRLKDLPEMKYFTRDSNGVEIEEPKGELLLRGNQIFQGYYKNEKETKKALSEDGWFSTGDVAKIDKYGRISIIDRVKNFFKLAQGEYITPERIENKYLSSVSGIIAQMFVYGDSYQTFLVSIIGVDPIQVRASLDSYNRHHRTFRHEHLTDEQVLAEINESVNLKKFFLKYINHQVRDQGLQGFEKIHNFKFAIEPLKLQDGVITPTFKIKRIAAKSFFEKELKELYAEGSLLKEKL